MRDSQYPRDEVLKEMGEALLEQAYTIFFDLGIKGDFCVQCTSGDAVVFGGWNRLIWTGSGWHIDTTSCTPDVVVKWETLKRNYNKSYDQKEIEFLDGCRKALESLTPGGSEYYRDPALCVSTVRDRFKQGHETKKELTKLRKDRR